MDNETVVTLEQMEETRGALSDKLEALGHQVADTVQGATTAVSDTVDTVRDAVHDTVEGVKETFDLRLQVERHPWGMLAGAVALGCLGSYVLLRVRPERSSPKDASERTPKKSPEVRDPGDEVARVHRLADETAVKEPLREETARALEPGWLTWTNDLFGTEIDKLKGLAIGSALSYVRDLVVTSLPKHLKPGAAEVMDSVTVKLGGDPVHGPLLND